MEKTQSGVKDVGRMPLKLSYDVLPQDQMPESMTLVTPEGETSVNGAPLVETQTVGKILPINTEISSKATEGNTIINNL